MRTSRHFVVIVLTSLLCAIFATGCDDIVSDPNFHTWCGDQLCSWKLESGQIRRAPTWNAKDYGVELLDSTDATHVTAISQVASTAAHCLEFSTVADVAPEAQVSIGLDFNNDGTVESDKEIAATGFTLQKTQITAPVGYDGLRFIITKKGTGRAVLAQMEVRSVDNCTAAPIVLMAQPLGATCSEKNNGDECSSGVCCHGVCSECCAACVGGGQCMQRKGVVGSDVSQCDPGQGTHKSGSECLANDDCMSKVCERERCQ